MSSYEVAIIGSGPAGLSAACHAAELGVSHVLLEKTPEYANTIQRYQKGKFVMAEPQVLPLRSPLRFEPCIREEVLEWWDERARELKVNTRFESEVTAISGKAGNFRIETANSEPVQAEHVILAIGLQGNLRKLGVEGEDLPFVQYQLDDPEAYRDETIVVVGAGDAAIENAMALAAQNKVYILNRRDEFTRAKDANNNAILKAIDSRSVPLECFYETNVERVEAVEEGDKPGRIHLNTPDGRAELAIDRVIARLGAIPPRKFVESCGVEFPSNERNAVPEVSPHYESNVPGLYIVGALAGYPLIKQAMNQGYEVIEFIRGNEVEPADTPLLKEKFSVIPGGEDVNATLKLIQDRIPMLAPLTPLQLREFLLDSTVHAPAPGDVIFWRRDYTNSIYSILEGNVEIQPEPEGDDPKRPHTRIRLGEGQFFGEMSLISGRRRSATVTAGEDCLLIETPRRSMLKLMQSVNAVKRIVDEVFLERAIQAHIAPGIDSAELRDVVQTAQVEQYKPDEVVFREGDPGDSLQLVRSGSLTVSRQIGDRDIVLAYIPAGQYVGEMALISDSVRTATVRAAVRTETIRLDGKAFKDLMDRHETVRERVQSVYKQRVASSASMEHQPEAGNIISFLIEQGLGEATDVLLIDESLCIRCDYCEKACADTHGGVSRLDREAGPTFAQVHVPTSCRHCEHPHCMKDCPPDAIHRNPNGEVFIDDTCIGCGNCEENCPYGVIQMGVESDKRSSLLTWLLSGWGAGPGEPRKAEPNQQKTAVKCDMCKDLPGGPACVRACPTGAALRASPEEFFRMTENSE